MQEIYDKWPRKREHRCYQSALLSGGPVLDLLVWPEDFQLYCHCLDSCRILWAGGLSKSITLVLKDTRRPS